MNRLKIILKEQHKSPEWLADQLSLDVDLVYMWCANISHPPLSILFKIAEILEVEVKVLWEANE